MSDDEEYKFVKNRDYPSFLSSLPLFIYNCPKYFMLGIKFTGQITVSGFRKAKSKLEKNI